MCDRDFYAYRGLLSNITENVADSWQSESMRTENCCNNKITLTTITHSTIYTNGTTKVWDKHLDQWKVIIAIGIHLFTLNGFYAASVFRCYFDKRFSVMLKKKEERSDQWLSFAVVIFVAATAAVVVVIVVVFVLIAAATAVNCCNRMKS